MSYSKKQWIVDAIIEKLERDEKEVENKLSEMLQSQADTYKQQTEQLQKELAEFKSKLL